MKGLEKVHSVGSPFEAHGISSITLAAASMHRRLSRTVYLKSKGTCKTCAYASAGHNSCCALLPELTCHMWGIKKLLIFQVGSVAKPSIALACAT